MDHAGPVGRLTLIGTVLTTNGQCFIRSITLGRLARVRLSVLSCCGNRNFVTLLPRVIAIDQRLQPGEQRPPLGIRLGRQARARAPVRVA